MVPHRTATFLSWLLLATFSTLVAAQNPESKVTYFHNLPARLFFFDDTEVAIYHDAIEGNVYVSPNEGKTWDTASDVPKGKAAMIIEHPFDNKYAFILTKGKTHYRTQDRGKSWRSFEVPIGMAYVPKPLSFHSDPKKFGYILFQGTVCDRQGWGSVCHDETYYTKDAFSSSPKKLLSETSRCQFAHSSKDFKHEAHTDLIYCVGFDTTSTNGAHSLSSSRLFSSTDFFDKENYVEDLGIGKNAKGVLALAIVSKFAVVALNDLSQGNDGEMLLYVSIDSKTWGKAQFPQSTTAKLRQNAYTIVESTTHSLAVDVKLQEMSSIGTLFVSNSNGTYFVESLKDTNRNDLGFVDFENLYGVEGVGLANVVKNAQDVEGRGASKQLRTMITFDDGSSWTPVRAPSTDTDGKRLGCDPVDIDTCSLHLHSVTAPHNFGRVFSSPAPGLVMAVGSVGEFLKPYDDCDTFLSTDAGVSWKMVRRDAHKYEFGDQGSIMVAVNDEDGADAVRYSTDFGKTWREWKIGMKLRARALTTLPDSTSQKFLLLGQISKQDEKGGQGRFAVVFLDFAKTRNRKCGADDFENWYARTAKGKQCLMGHKQWYKRRKADANCYVGEKFDDPVEHEDNCACSDDDYECDYNYVRDGDHCVPVGPEPIPAGVCTGTADQKYKGSSGYRLIPGNTCIKSGGVVKDDLVEKPCSQAKPEEGKVSHQIFQFPSQIVQESYFKDSSTILVRLADHSIWQSSNEGYTWTQRFPEEKFLAFYMHAYSNERAYLVTSSQKFYYTSNAGRAWNVLSAPNPPNTFNAQVLQFHPQSDYLIWTGNSDCGSMGRGDNCRADSFYTRDNGRHWTLVEKYVRNCAWARDDELKLDPSQIICESYRDKQGSQTFFKSDNPLQLVGGTKYFEKKTKLFDQVVGFAKFSEFLIVAEYLPSKGALDLQVSLDGRNFATGKFPPNMHPETHAYTVLESTTKSVFLHMTMSDVKGAYWGNILKSNSNGTYYGLSIDNVNRDDRGYVDFEKMIGLDGIALINVVTNPEEAVHSKRKDLQTRITHNDGSTWKSLVPPKVDSQGRKYECSSTKCALHIHGYTERFDSRATYSSPSVVGLLLAVGNVGEKLAAYTDSDTFLSRDAGFTWEEVHKDAHLFEFGDSGSVLVMVNDEEPVDYVLFSTDEGLNWREYKFGDKKMRVKSIVTVPSDTSRKFILMGFYGHDPASVVVHLDFSSLTSKQCQLSIDDPGHDDFELWSPSEERSERCLFGRQTLYHRRKREVQCVVGEQKKAADKLVKNCVCTMSDFECEFNHVKNDKDECVLSPGLTPRADNDEVCRNGEEFWYERTAYRLIPFSSCVDGIRPDRGPQHACPSYKSHGFFWWLFMLAIPFGITAMVASWYIRRSGLTRGNIRLPGDTRSFGGDSGIVGTLASIPWFLVGIAGVAFEFVASKVDDLRSNFGGRGRGGYRNVAVDEDAQILRFEDED